MGEVYRATDMNLGRDVAIKILPGALAQDAERLARFEREARTLASLNHPNIAIVHGVEKAEGTYALVMEMVEGETLADRIARGAVALEDALPIARQLADALEAAHEQGIVHRDLKPANIKLRPDGTVKVLDFGLAKIVEASGANQATAVANHSAGRAGVSQSPTITTPAMTQIGLVLGTAAYMAPEQARGKPVDKRADIWAFGAVVFEMLTGRRAFDGDDVSITLAAVMMKEPDWGAWPSTVPGSLRRLVSRCLKKDPKARLRDIGEARLQIDELFAGPFVEEVVAPAPQGRTSWRTAFGAAALLVVALTAITLVVWAPWREPPTVAPVRLEAGIGADVTLVTDQGPSAILSPDGTTLAFVAQKTGGGETQLYVRRLEQLQATLLAGTEGARNPFFSPDGEWIAFFAAAKLKKIAITGGAVVTLCDAPDGRGGSWVEDGTIVFLPVATSRGGPDGGGGLLRVSSAGGQPEPVTTVGEDDLTQRWPQILPGGKAVLYTVTNPAATRHAIGAYAEANIVVQTIPKGTPKVVWRGGYFGRYLESGHLVFVRDGTLFAAPFDVERLERLGEPAPVLEGMVFGPNTGAAQLSVSNEGSLVYVPGGGVARSGTSFEWVSRTGEPKAVANSENWVMLRLSPDGNRMAVVIATGASPDIWIHDAARELTSRLTTAPDLGFVTPVWTPNGQRIVFSSLKTRNLFWQRTDGTGVVDRLTNAPTTQTPASWHPNGRLLAYEQMNPGGTLGDIMILPIEGDETSGWKPGTPRPFLNTEFHEQDPMFSPDGRWMALVSSKSGRPQVYVRSYPGPAGEWVISSGGARFPTWSHKRNELFYTTLQGEIMMVPFKVAGDAFIPGKPERWSTERVQQAGGSRRFDLHPDGDRVLMARVPPPQETARQDRVVFVFNFFDELRRRVPR